MLTDLPRHAGRLSMSDALKESEANYRAVVDNVTDGIAINVDSTRVFVNRAFLTIHGLTDESQAVGSEVDRYIVDEDKAGVRERTIARQRGEEVSQKNEFRIRRPDGTLRWVESSSARIFYEGIPAALTILRDITDRKEIELSLAKHAEELARSNRDLEDFAYVASHDLQEPLRMISSFAELLQQRYQGNLGGEGEEFLSYVIDGSQRMRSLINDLLAYSRVGTRGAEPQLVTTSECVEEALANLHTAMEESGTTVECGPLPDVVADPRQLSQVFQNLIGNAIKFRGDASPRIEVNAATDDRETLFSVRDNGIGIDPSYADRIFVVFQRLHTRAQYSGTGIGLAICKKIVERHGGRIWVESQPGEGSTFYFTFPAGARSSS